MINTCLLLFILMTSTWLYLCLISDFIGKHLLEDLMMVIMLIYCVAIIELEDMS